MLEEGYIHLSYVPLLYNAVVSKGFQERMLGKAIANAWSSTPSEWWLAGLQAVFVMEVWERGVPAHRADDEEGMKKGALDMYLRCLKVVEKFDQE